ncbi:AsmA family protein [Neisseria shayeganii]|uniref:AsmA family protein n=1 Tax=Neisseria shayeganii TaxID=607712 RepID=A0A7D7N3Z0_9NEIS|nr:AsmA family protein [Neisseria shayeganii]QMT39500.1 AsmA family protein [Neisseria shayeganii]
MTRLLQSGKFWLKSLTWGLLLPLLLIAGMHSGLHYFFSETRIREAAAAAFADKGQELSFNGTHITRGWFPYPFFTLHDVRLSRPHQPNETAFRADSLQVAFSWSSLWGDPSIRRIRAEDADLYLRQTEQGAWQIADRPLSADDTETFLPQRIELIQSTLHLQTQRQRFSLLQTEGHFDRSDGSFHWEAGLFSPQEAHLSLSGRLVDQSAEVVFQAASFLPNGHPFTLRWQGTADIEAEAGRLTSRNGSLNFHLPDTGFNLDAQTQGWQLSAAGAELPETRFVFHTAYGALEHNGSGKIRRAAYHNDILHIDSFQAETALSQHDSQTALNLSGSFTRYPEGRFRIGNLHIDTRHTAGPGSLPAFVGHWQGQIEGPAADVWQLQLQGSFDHQPAQFQLHARQQAGLPVFDGRLQLDKLALTPYLPENTRAVSLSADTFQSWRQLMGRRRLQLAADIGVLETSGLHIQDFQARLSADAEHIRAEAVEMALYEGRALGHAVLHNRPVPEWAGEIHFSDIQIKPLLQDAFRFNHLSGRGEARFSLSSAGLNSQEWLAGLGGRAELSLEHGAWQGINLGKLLDRPEGSPEQSLFFYNAESRTPFDRFRIEADLKNGIGHTPALSLNSSSLNLSGQGSFDTRTQTLNYALLASAGRNLWLPFKIGGSINRPSFALDYERITGGLQTPEQKRQALQEVFNQQWQWIQKLPEPAPAAKASQPQP